MRSLLCAILLTCSVAANAQIPPEMTGRTDTELYLSLAVLAFGILVLIGQIAVMFRVGKGWGTSSIRISGLTLVITAGLFLTTAGYSENQIAPMIGLLGTIAGYLLGKSESSN